MNNQFEGPQSHPEETKEKIKKVAETKEIELEREEKLNKLSRDIFEKRMRGEGEYSYEKIEDFDVFKLSHSLSFGNF